MKKQEPIILIFDNQVLDEYLKYYFKRYPRRSKKPIEEPIHPSINKWFIMPRPQMNNLKQAWGAFTDFVINKNKVENLNINKCSITYKYYFGNKRRQDVDNRICKFVNDSLIKNKIIIDDCYSHVNPMILWGGYDKENPRMELHIHIKN